MEEVRRIKQRAHIEAAQEQGRQVRRVQIIVWAVTAVIAAALALGVYGLYRAVSPETNVSTEAQGE